MTRVYAADPSEARLIAAACRTGAAPFAGIMMMLSGHAAIAADAPQSKPVAKTEVVLPPGVTEAMLAPPPMPRLMLAQPDRPQVVKPMPANPRSEPKKPTSSRQTNPPVTGAATQQP